MTELFTLVHRTLRIAEEMDRQPRMDVMVNNLNELILVPHNDAGAAAVNVIQKWMGFEPHRIYPGDRIAIYYPVPDGGEQEPSSGDRSDPQRTGSAEPRSESPISEGQLAWGERNKRKKEENSFLPPPP